MTHISPSSCSKTRSDLTIKQTFQMLQSVCINSCELTVRYLFSILKPAHVSNAIMRHFCTSTGASPPGFFFFQPSNVFLTLREALWTARGRSLWKPVRLRRLPVHLGGDGAELQLSLTESTSVAPFKSNCASRCQWQSERKEGGKKKKKNSNSSLKQKTEGRQS